ncbi:MAG TPA: hypothetical protein DCY94_02920, partial [Firmicutes bacterium]|nr:hypothetical protein [Bacillota bacterium]
MKKDFIAVILGSDDNAYGFARAIYEEFNQKSIALATSLIKVSANSKILDVIVDTKLHNEKHLIEVLLDLGKKLKREYEKIFIIACSDSYLEMLVRNKDKLESIYENKFIDVDLLYTFNNKKRFYEMCEKHKIPYPKFISCTPKDYEDAISRIDFGFPLILKPDNSNSLEYLDAEFDGKEKVYFIRNKKELLKKIETIYSSSYQGILIIQKFIRGDDTNMRVLNTYSDKNGKVRVMSLGQPILEEYHPILYGNYAAIISVEGIFPIMKELKAFLEEIKYTGAANFDIKIDDNSKQYFLLEMNPRPGRSSLYSTFSGASIQTAYVEDLVYGKLSDNLGNTQEVLWMNVPMKLVKKYVKDEAVLDKVSKLAKCDQVFHSLIYKKDLSLKRRLNLIIYYLRKLRYF